PVARKSNNTTTLQRPSIFALQTARPQSSSPSGTTITSPSREGVRLMDTVPPEASSGTDQVESGTSQRKSSCPSRARPPPSQPSQVRLRSSSPSTPQTGYRGKRTAETTATPSSAKDMSPGAS